MRSPSLAHSRVQQVVPHLRPKSMCCSQAIASFRLDFFWGIEPTSSESTVENPLPNTFVRDN
jgi:hypothetical protein